MLGEHNVFIDFALSKVGPIAVDMAKLVSDFLLRVPALRTDGVPEWTDTTHSVMQALEPTRATLHFTPGDIELFRTLLSIYLAQSLNYNDVPRETKEWVKSVLCRNSGNTSSC
jgi:hypothetical protein